MARNKINEWKAKTLLTSALHMPYEGISFHSSNDAESKLEQLDSKKNYVVKVDEGIKKRMKNGLVVLNKNKDEVKEAIRHFSQRGFTRFVIEPFIDHKPSSEKYLSIERIREGLRIMYSQNGGIDIEENQDTIKQKIVTDYQEAAEVASSLAIKEEVLQTILQVVDDYHFSFFEINPLVVEADNYYFLDIAAEVDSAGAFFVQGVWGENDFSQRLNHQKTEEERKVELLSQKSQASFKLDVFNPNGSIFMLLSGGGASIVLADEVYNLGFGNKLANYGEYSGNPNAEEVYLYTKNLLSLLLKSESSDKVLVIAGGVANFTDVRKTFLGIIKALSEVSEDLQKQHVKVFVRRGGPHQKEGLMAMETFLKEHALYGFVGDPRTPLPDIIKRALGI